MKKGILYLILIFAAFLLYTGVLFINFQIFTIPSFILISGFLLRIIFKEKYLLFFTFMIPLTSGLAYFENHGFPFNYLMLPLFLLFGIFLADLFLRKGKVIETLNRINPTYLFFLILIYISVFFVFLRWSNVTLSLSMLFKNTPISPNGERLSFGVFFPLLNLVLFTVSYIYFQYLKEYKDKVKLIFAFAVGQSIAIIFSLLQNIFHLRLFSWAKFNGTCSDSPSLGFLSSILLLLSWYLVVKKKKYVGIFLIVIALSGILNSHAKTGLISIGFCALLMFFSFKGRTKILIAFLMILIGCNFIFYLYNPKVAKKSALLNETRGAIESAFQLMWSDSVLEEEGKQTLFASRERSWTYSVNIIQNFPLSGVGVGNFISYVKYTQFGKNYRDDHPNNQYFYIVTAVGIIGFLVFFSFLYQVIINQKNIFKIFLLCIYIMLVFANYFWTPEGILVFWLFISIESHGIKESGWSKKLPRFLLGFLLVVFVFSEIYNFSSLHPKNWSLEMKQPYDYGFWYREKDQEGKIYHWTKAESGMYITLKNGTSKTILLGCGAPLNQLKDKKQQVWIYWEGELYDKIVFSKNERKSIIIKDNQRSSGLLEFKIFPVFNLKELKAGPESRDLGIQVFQ